MKNRDLLTGLVRDHNRYTAASTKLVVKRCSGSGKAPAR